MAKNSFDRELMPFRATVNLCQQTTNPLVLDILKQFYSLFYAIPTTLLSIFVVCLIKKQANYYAIVYQQLFTMCSFLNLICWWLEFFTLEVAGFWPLCPFIASLSNQYFLSIPQYFIACFPVACLLCNTTIAIYQMFTILFPTSCEQKFKKYIYLIYLIIVLLPLITSTHLLLSKLTMMPLTSTRLYMKANHIWGGFDWITATFVNGIIGIISLSVIGISSLVAIGRYWQIKKNSNGTIKLKMFAINLYICLSTVIYIAFQIMMFYARVVKNDINLLSSYWYYRGILSDICYLPIPWFVLLVNRRMRTSLRDLFGRKQVTTIVGQTQHSSTGNMKP